MRPHAVLPQPTGCLHGVVADRAFSHFDLVILNDLLFSNEISYKAFFGVGKYSQKKIEDFKTNVIMEMKKNKKTNYFDKNFGEKFFSKNSAREIGFIRQKIENCSDSLNSRERAILITSLLYSADRIANTVGHYEAYRKNAREFKEFEFRLIKPQDKLKSKIYREDSNALVRKIKADVVYIDPPYNSRQYSRFYHVLETLTKWDSPKLSGVALKPPLENLSDYCTVSAPEAFSDLISNIDAKLILVSYNNTYASKSSSSKNKITIEQIRNTLMKKGKTRIQEVEHKYFSAGKTDFKNHLEYIFVTEVN